MVVAPLAMGMMGCADDKSTRYDEDRGFYRADEIRVDSEDRDELLARGEAMEEAGNLLEAAAWYRAVARKYPRRRMAIEARMRQVRVLVRMREFRQAHNAMIRLVDIYKEELQLTRSQELWDELRHIWYEDIGLGLFFRTAARKEISDDLDPAIKVFERLLKEEFRGRYAALCLLRIGDCYAHKGEYLKARTHYLRVVRDYQDFQDLHEHEEGLYKAALATLATMKGADYDLGLIEAPGSDTEEKGALDLCRDYESAYPRGKFRQKVAALEAEIFSVLCWRDFNAGEVYERLGEPRAARMQFQLVVDVWGDDTKYPDQQQYVDRAREKLRNIDEPEDDN